MRHFDHLCQRARSLAGSADPGRAFFDFFGQPVEDDPERIWAGSR